MKIGIPKESQAGERRVAATPKTVAQLIGLGYDVAVQSGAGEAASYPDAAYVAEGATIVKGVGIWKSDIVTKINPPTTAEIARLPKGSTLISLLAPLTQAGLNPARDFAPRLVALLFGWGKWAFPDQMGGAFFVYMLGPVVGGLMAGLLFTSTTR